MAQEFEKELQFKTRWHHRKPTHWLQKYEKHGDGIRNHPEVVILAVEPGVEPSTKPPVRIFLGTESQQYRPERVFIWSIMQVRDPSRVYEIHMLKDLRGYDRSKWKTGFTGFRYAIPVIADGTGRAIYNDVDQIYLSDPAELFDMKMGDAGILGVTGRDTSVMLIDCSRMVDLWKIEDVTCGKKHRHFRDITHANNKWGQLPGEWNARDDEYRSGKSKCLHYTTLQTQPWQPFKDRLFYKPNAQGDVWFELERAADKARFTTFTKDQPSHRFRDMVEQYREMHDHGEAQLGLTPEQTFDGHSLAKHHGAIGHLNSALDAETLLDYGCGKGSAYSPWPGESEDSRLKSHPEWPGVKVTCYDPGYAPYADPYNGRCDGVITTDVLEHIPEEDIAWVLDDLFGAANKFVYAAAACYPARKVLPNGENAHCTVQSPEWWRGQMELAARRFPGIRWQLCAERNTFFGKTRRHVDGKSAGEIASAV